MSNNLTAVISADTTGFKKSIQEAKTLLKQYTDTAKGSSNVIKKNTSISSEQVAAYNRVVKALEKTISGTQSTSKAEKELTNQIKELKIQWQNLSDSAKRSDFGKSLSDSCKTAQSQLKQLQSQIKSVGTEMKTPSTKIGGGFDLKGKFMSGLGMATGVGSAMAATQLAINTLKDGVTATSNFNFAQSKLQAVTGKSVEELSSLKEQALNLGATTKYTATEIAGLQVELAKLGFSPGQIEKMTEHVQNFATAVDTDLSSAASLTGATLRMFGLEAEDTQRVVDVLSASCSKSALDFTYLSSAMSTVGPVANAFGISLEDTTALLGTLANAGFDASSAATATRNILLNLADANGDLAQELGKPVKSGKELMTALVELRNRGVDLSTALELTDKRSVAAFESFLSGAESGAELIDALNGCSGAAKNMSDIMEDNLQGDVAILKSAWEGLMLEMGGGQSVLRSLIQWITSLVDEIHSAGKAIADWCKDLYNDSLAVRIILNDLVMGFKNAFAVIKFVIQDFISGVKGFFKVLGKVLEGDFKGAAEAWKDMVKEINSEASEMAGTIKGNITKAIDNTFKTKAEVEVETTIKTDESPISKILAGNTTTSSGSTRTPSGSKTKDKSGSKNTSNALEGSKKWIQEQISEHQKLRDSLVAETDEWNKQNTLLSILENRLKKITDLEKVNNTELPKIKEISPFKDTVNKLAGKSPFEKYQDDLDNFKRHYDKLMKDLERSESVFGSIGDAFSSLGDSLEIPELNAVGIISGAIASMIQGYGIATAQAGSMGPWAWIGFAVTGLATLATMISQVKNLGSFADGGIISGPTSVGDYNLARVNSGEMIINGSQQQRLFNMLNTGQVNKSDNIDLSKVEFVIKGNNLVGTFSNYNKKMNRI